MRSPKNLPTSKEHTTTPRVSLAPEWTDRWLSFTPINTQLLRALWSTRACRPGWDHSSLTLAFFFCVLLSFSLTRHSNLHPSERSPCSSCLAFSFPPQQPSLPTTRLCLSQLDSWHPHPGQPSKQAKALMQKRSPIRPVGALAPPPPLPPPPFVLWRMVMRPDSVASCASPRGFPPPSLLLPCPPPLPLARPPVPLGKPKKIRGRGGGSRTDGIIPGLLGGGGFIAPPFRNPGSVTAGREYRLKLRDSLALSSAPRCKQPPDSHTPPFSIRWGGF